MRSQLPGKEAVEEGLGPPWSGPALCRKATLVASLGSRSSHLGFMWECCIEPLCEGWTQHHHGLVVSLWSCYGELYFNRLLVLVLFYLE